MTVIPPGFAWDARGLLNLAATDRAEEILSALERPSYAVKEVLEGEVLYLRPSPKDEDQDSLHLIDLTPLLKDGALQVVELSDAEIPTFVEAALAIDDGEARTAAYAVHHGLEVVTDDRATIRYLRSLSPPLAALTTPDWVKRWADRKRISSEILSEVLRDIEARARFRPRRDHALKRWWDEKR